MCLEDGSLLCSAPPAAETQVAWACQLACQLEVAADKPGNVTYHKPFADVAAEQFLASSIAIGPAFRRIADRGVGAVILQAVEDTRYLVDSNTNLGMLLLLAPLARAALRTRPRTFRDRVGAVLEELTVADTADVYRAIRLAMPGGLGGAHRYDVCGETPAVPLQEAMKEAAPRDSVAGEYVTSFATTFSIGLPVLRRALSHGHRLRDAVTQSYLVTLASCPDSLIARKVDIQTARRVSADAGAVRDAGGIYTEEGRKAIRGLDERLRDSGNTLNPGTTADLTAAALFVVVFEALEESRLPELLRRW